MRKKFLALLCATVLVFAMSMNVCAAESPSGSSNSATEESDDDSSSVSSESLAIGGQQLTEETLDVFAATTSAAAAPAGATIAPVSAETAAAAVAAAKTVVGNNATIASVVDINASEGGTFTLNVPVVKAGQKVYVFHQMSNGIWENLPVSKVANGQVTFSMTSYSPVAIIVDNTAGKTGDVVTAVAAMAIAGLTGAVAFGKKKED